MKMNVRQEISFLFVWFRLFVSVFPFSSHVGRRERGRETGRGNEREEREKDCCFHLHES